MLEELQEADVLWPDTAAADDRHHLELFITASMRRQDDKCASTAGHNEDRMKGSSLPIAIPRMKTGGGRTDRREEEREVFDEEGMVPPHILASRRINGGEVAFSLCGDRMRRRQLRIAVLRMTGFLEN
ncbi:hypothetical protein KSP40_PGU017971 [Platanthera guangdongensis]|uniref:Uncharacterized protein n=1 Tax=Platanthera guangdongensis TaxID=2320717 RepID=A0ABR2M086_9ASPA